MREASNAGASPVDQVVFRAEVDTAIAELPDRYRRPMVLFHLEDRSGEETARILGLSSDALRTRLVRAREMLRGKLVRRGVAIGSVGALTTLLSAEAGAAVLPATFVSATVKAAGLAAAGKLAAGVGAGTVSANVAAITKGAVNMLFWSSVKTAVVAVAVTSAVVGTSTVVAQKAMETTPAATIASKPKTMDLPSLIRLRREQNLLTGEWICPTNPADLGDFETIAPRLGWSAGGQPSEQGQRSTFTIYGTNAAERSGSGIWHFKMRANTGNSNFWIMVMYGTKAPIACIEYIQFTNELRLIRTVWTADGRFDPDRRLDVRTGPNIEELKAKAGDDLRKHLAPVLAMVTPGDLLGVTEAAEQDTPAARKVKLGIQDGMKLLRDGRFQEAIAAFEATGGLATGQSDGMNAEILFWKAECCRKAGNTNDAITVLRDLLQKYPKTRWAALAHGRLAEMTQKTGRTGN